MKYYLFTSANCAPCKTLYPVISKHPHIQTIDIQQRPELVSKYNIRAVPTLVVADIDGRLIRSICGTPNIMNYLTN